MYNKSKVDGKLFKLLSNFRFLFALFSIVGIGFFIIRLFDATSNPPTLPVALIMTIALYIGLLGSKFTDEDESNRSFDKTWIIPGVFLIIIPFFIIYQSYKMEHFYKTNTMLLSWYQQDIELAKKCSKPERLFIDYQKVSKPASIKAPVLVLSKEYNQSEWGFNPRLNDQRYVPSSSGKQRINTIIFVACIDSSYGYEEDPSRVDAIFSCSILSRDSINNHWQIAGSAYFKYSDTHGSLQGQEASLVYPYSWFKEYIFKLVSKDN